MTLSDLSPADMGCLAATLDDCLACGFGDDAICEALARTLVSECGHRLPEIVAFGLGMQFLAGQAHRLPHSATWHLPALHSARRTSVCRPVAIPG